MPSWWNSIETLARVQYWARFGLVVAGVITAVVAVFLHFVGTQIDSLKSLQQTELNRRLESTQQELETTKARLQPRSLSQEQRRLFLEVAAQGPKGPIEVVSVLGDGESQAFAEELMGLLKGAGWNPNGVSQALFSGTPKGLILRVHNEQKVPAHAETLAKAIKAAGLEVIGEVIAQVPEGHVELLVGHKP